MKTRTHAGFTLTEITIVLGIVGVVLGGIWVGAAAVDDSRKSARAVAQILEISNNVRDMFAMRQAIDTTNGSSNLMPKLVATNAFPSDMPIIAGLPQNAWGGNVVVWVIAADIFRVAYYSVPNVACTHIANSVITNSGTSNANPVTFVTNSGGYSVDLRSITVDSVAIATACSKNNSAGNSVEFDFKLTQ